MITLESNSHLKGSRLTNTEARVLPLLLMGCNQVDAARRAGVHQQRVSEMLRRPHFVRALELAKQALLQRAVIELSKLLPKALKRIDAALMNPTDPGGLRAAFWLLERLGVGSVLHAESVGAGQAAHFDSPEALRAREEALRELRRIQDGDNQATSK